jgi:hypothetical protein
MTPNNSSSFPATASDSLNVAIFTCFELNMSRDRFFHTSDLSVLKHSFLFTRGTSVNSCSVYIQINFNTFAFAKKIFHLK